MSTAADAQSAAAAGGAQAGNAEGTPAALASWIGLTAPPGAADEALTLLLRTLDAWTADGRGNLVKRVGSGSPRRVVACALDYSAYVVSQITDDGYLRLRRTGPQPSHPLWDQFLEAQRVSIFGAKGRLPGVVAVANGHFARQDRGDTVVVGVDELWVDVGAGSRRQVVEAGIALLDPVSTDRPPWHFGRFASGPAAGARAGCAAVAAAAQSAPSAGETVFVISTGRPFGWLGLANTLSGLGAVDTVVMVDVGTATGGEQVVAPARLPTGVRTVLRQSGTTVRSIAPAVRWAGSHVETIERGTAISLLRAVSAAAGTAPPPGFTAIPLDTARRLVARTDALGPLERQLITLLDLPGVPGHESLVRDEILRALPDWARRVAVTDPSGNVIVAAGPDRDSIAFVAHMDEVAFELDRILPDGQVTLRRLGGVVTQSWEGVPALLHFDPPAAGSNSPLRGVFIPRDSARLRVPAALTAWFGHDSAALVRLGVRPGMGITAYKRAARLLGTRVTGRASDDRSGSTALLFALRRINPDQLARKVLFVWSVQEEGGLVGARAFGERHGRNLRNVYSVDTFVSSDTPIESPHFAWTPLGAGPVLRGLDDGSLAPRAERDRIMRIAASAGVAVQVGTTHGSTDGSAISPWGPPNVGLSWPGRYSHGPAEVLDLRDLDGLSRLIAAVALAR
ncbi:MAG: M20/M25/M40 family metallo-hydrolase [Gemmatimonadota bacterium]